MLNPIPLCIIKNPLAAAVRIMNADIVAIAVILIPNSFAIILKSIIRIGMDFL